MTASTEAGDWVSVCTTLSLDTKQHTLNSARKTVPNMVTTVKVNPHDNSIKPQPGGQLEIQALLQNLDVDGDGDIDEEDKKVSGGLSVLCDLLSLCDPCRPMHLVHGIVHSMI